MSEELKIVFTGPMGAGKTTAIAAISDVPPILTDAVNNDRAAFDKESTTVALDYGQLHLNDGINVRLYGTPGQDRFAFMRRILCDGAIGIVLLLDGSRDDATEQLESYLRDLLALKPLPVVVIGVGRCRSPDQPILRKLSALLESKHLNMPVFGVDVRRRQDVFLLVETLVCMLEVTANFEATK